MLSTQITIGSQLKINVQAKTTEDLFIEASLWYELPCKCGKCESDRLGLRYRRSKDYDFYELVCLDCEATFALGQKKESSGGGLYPRGNKDTGEWDVKHEREERHSRDDDRGDSRGSDRGRGRDDDRGRGRDDRRHSDERGGGGRGDRGDRGGSRREESSDRGRGSYRKDAGGESDDVPY
jgi:hypothetical protein